MYNSKDKHSQNTVGKEPINAKKTEKNVDLIFEKISSFEFQYGLYAL